MAKSETLDNLAAGTAGRIIALRGGREFQHRIQSMGLSVGSEVGVIQNNDVDGENGGVVVRAGDTRLMIGHGMANKIVVRAE